MQMRTRRDFLRTGILAAGAALAAPAWPGKNQILAGSMKSLHFRPHPSAWMPEITWAYAADQQGDPFRSDIQVVKEGIQIPENFGSRRFSLTTRWFVEDFGYLMLAADNGGELYSREDFNRDTSLNLNYEFARTRIIRNRQVLERYIKTGTKFSLETVTLKDLSEELFESADKAKNDPQRCVKFADKALSYALWTGEKIELEQARSRIERQKRTDNVYFGCESRQYIWAKSETFTQRFPELFNFATVTHYVWDTWYQVFEPREGHYNWGVKDDIVNWLLENEITVQGRPLFWFHPAVTPEWLKEKSFKDLKNYIVRHTKDLITHYGDKIRQWAVINEYHDWANIHNHTPEQITEITRLACDTTKSVDPGVSRIINNCCPFGDYVPWGKMSRQKTEADRPLRTPRKYIEDIESAGVDYDVLGIQIYFPQRDLSDIVRLLEKFEAFGKPIYITEIGVTSFGINRKKVDNPLKLAEQPYDWHRFWDEELQAEWLDDVYSIYYSRPSVKAVNWYDFSDFRPFIVNGGLVREDCSPKQSFQRLKELLSGWNRLPERKK